MKNFAVLKLIVAVYKGQGRNLARGKTRELPMEPSRLTARGLAKGCGIPYVSTEETNFLRRLHQRIRSLDGCGCCLKEMVGLLCEVNEGSDRQIRWKAAPTHRQLRSTSPRELDISLSHLTRAYLGKSSCHIQTANQQSYDCSGTSIMLEVPLGASMDTC